MRQRRPKTTNSQYHQGHPLCLAVQLKYATLIMINQYHPEHLLYLAVQLNCSNLMMSNALLGRSANAGLAIQSMNLVRSNIGLITDILVTGSAVALGYNEVTADDAIQMIIMILPRLVLSALIIVLLISNASTLIVRILAGTTIMMSLQNPTVLLISLMSKDFDQMKSSILV